MPGRTLPRLAVALAALAAAAVAPAAASASPPSITYTLTGAPGDGSWFRGPVTVKWTVNGETASDGCDTSTLTSDTVGATRTCRAVNADGSVTATTRKISIDQTAPAGVNAVPARPADHGTWYTAPVAVGWSGSDATSGVVSCTSLTYGGPDAAPAPLSGTCRDGAGNVSAPRGLKLYYDATPPALTAVAEPATPGDALVRWTAGVDATRVTVVRAPDDDVGAVATIFDGGGGASRLLDHGLTGGRTYTWTVSASDAAANTAVARATATPEGAVETTTTATPPREGAATATGLATSAPAAARPIPSAAPRRLLRWAARPGAAYYNVQLLRGGAKVLSAWPSATRFGVPATWTFRGRARRLLPGTYRWYVWPGYGPRTRHRYGRLLAHGTFRVP